MSGLNREPEWLEQLENAEWIRNTALGLIEYYGVEQFKREKPILIRHEHEHLRDTSTRDYLTAIAKDMYKAARIPVRDIIVDLYTEQSAAATLSDLGIPYESAEQSGSAGIFHRIDAYGKAHIAVEEGQMQDELSLAGTLGHELAHVFLHLKRPPASERWPAEDEEPVTDIAAVLLGFGIYQCNSAERFRGYTDGQMEGWSASKQGYLSLEEICYAQAFLHNFYDQDFESYKSHLSANPRHFVRAAIPPLKIILRELKAADSDVRRLHEEQLETAEPEQPVAAHARETRIRRPIEPSEVKRATGKPFISRPVLAALPFISVVLLDVFARPLIPLPKFLVAMTMDVFLVFFALLWYRVLSKANSHDNQRKPEKPALILRMGAHGIAIMMAGTFLILEYATEGLFMSDTSHGLDMVLVMGKAFIDFTIAFLAIGYYGFVSGRFRM